MCRMDVCVWMRETWFNFLYLLKFHLHRTIELTTPLKKVKGGWGRGGEGTKQRSPHTPPYNLHYFKAVLKLNVDLGGNGAERLEMLKTNKYI